jgi:DNA-binding MarR family transcriptional regulator
MIQHLGSLCPARGAIRDLTFPAPAGVCHRRRVGDAMILDRTTVGHLVEPLKRDSFVRTDPDPNHHRSRRISVTEKERRKRRSKCVRAPIWNLCLGILGHLTGHRQLPPRQRFHRRARISSQHRHVRLARTGAEISLACALRKPGPMSGRGQRLALVRARFSIARNLLAVSSGRSRLLLLEYWPMLTV